MTLLIFKVNQLGDNVVFLPLVQALRACLPHWRIVVVTSSAASTLYEICCPNAEIVEKVTKDFNTAWRSPLELKRLTLTMRDLKPDACLLGDDQGNVAHLIARLSGAKICVGPLTKKVRVNVLLHERVPPPPGMHVAWHNWEIAQVLLRRLGLPELPAAPPPPDLSFFGREDHGAIVIHAGASRAYKRWPLENYVELANRLARQNKVIWMDQNHSQEEALHPGVQRLSAGSLGSFVRLLAGASYFIGNNSGPMNLASALGVPSTIFNGPSTPNWDPPWHAERFELLRDSALSCQPCDLLTHPVNACQNKVQPMICMLRWTVEEVFNRVRRRVPELG
ncbi:MAG: glycosyltransferase family 9 protein [Verrucomicrobiaceae bacterium]|nr:glycosyltransferase family 9 protein [Verrucomicrobiaceae bacterium]